MDGITVPSSVFVNGRWATAHWMADVVDEATGEMVITATLVGEGEGPVVTALRMDMALARGLRAMAGFGADGSDEADGGCYDCRTNGERIENLERETLVDRQVLHAMANRVDALEAMVNNEHARRILALETSLRAHLPEQRGRLDALEKRINELGQLSEAIIRDCVDIETRVDALEAWQIAVAQDGDDDDTLFRLYDTINRVQRAKAAGGG